MPDFSLRRSEKSSVAAIISAVENSLKPEPEPIILDTFAMASFSLQKSILRCRSEVRRSLPWCCRTYCSVQPSSQSPRGGRYVAPQPVEMKVVWLLSDGSEELYCLGSGSTILPLRCIW